MIEQFTKIHMLHPFHIYQLFVHFNYPLPIKKEYKHREGKQFWGYNKSACNTLGDIACAHFCGFLVQIGLLQQWFRVCFRYIQYGQSFCLFPEFSTNFGVFVKPQFDEKTRNGTQNCFQDQRLRTNNTPIKLWCSDLGCYSNYCLLRIVISMSSLIPVTEQPFCDAYMIWSMICAVISSPGASIGIPGG